MKIEPITPDELPLLAGLAREFYASSRFLEGFDIDRFTTLWTHLIDSGAGVVFCLSEEGEFRGVIGGVIYPEPYSGVPVATEFFWFVSPSSRGGGIRLYRAFEGWARERGCGKIRMVHLLDSMPEQLERVYRRWGFEPAEIHYTKDLK